MANSYNYRKLIDCLMYRDHTYVQLTMIRILVAKEIAILRHYSTNRYKLQYQIVSTEKDTG